MLPANALIQWQDQVRACRNARLETEEQAWQRAAAWYESWVRYNDYVQLTLPHVLPFIHSKTHVLEIGPGTGAFTLPIARWADKVLAVEPSPNMRNLLGRNLTKGRIKNVEIVEQSIEEVVGNLQGNFDLAFASFSLYNVVEIDVVLQDLLRVAKRVMVLIGTGEPLPWYRDLYLRWRGKAPVPSPQLPHLYALLIEMGIYADVQVLRSSYNYVYDSEDALVDWWQRYFHLEENDRDALRVSLLPYMEQRGQQVGIFSQNSLALVSIERGRNYPGDATIC